MNTLHLDKLKGGIIGISSAYGAFLMEAAVVCLAASGHTSGVQLKVEGDFEADFQLEWALQVGETERSSWRDLKEATEYAAMGLAILLMSELTDYRIFERTDQNDEADFVMKVGQEVSVIKEVLLEVSGILTEMPGNSINMRLSTKKKEP